MSGQDVGAGIGTNPEPVTKPRSFGQNIEALGKLGENPADNSSRDLRSARERSEAAGLPARVRFLASKFSDLPPSLKKEGLWPFGGALADLGVSRYQLTAPARGFSLQNDGPLDMRMNRSDGETASDIVNYSSEKELADLIYKLAEERRSRQISRAIVKARPIRSTAHLAAVVESAHAPLTSYSIFTALACAYRSMTGVSG